MRIVIALVVYYILLLTFSSLIPPLPFDTTGIFNAFIFCAALNLDLFEGGILVSLSAFLFFLHFNIPLVFILINHAVLFLIAIYIKNISTSHFNPYFLLLMLFTFFIAEIAPYPFMAFIEDKDIIRQILNTNLPRLILSSFFFYFPVSFLLRILFKKKPSSNIRPRGQS